VTSLEADCDSECVEPLLAAVTKEHCSSSSASLFKFSVKTVSLLSCVTALKSCDLVGDCSNQESLDVQALGALPHLVNLGLRDSMFDHVGKAAHLTQLRMLNAISNFSKDRQYIDTLQMLHMVESSLLDIHAQGLLACKALRHLNFYISKVETDEPRYSFADVTLPVLSALRSLKSIECVVHGISYGRTIFDCVCDLSNLEGMWHGTR